MRYFIVGVAAGSKPFVNATSLLGVEHPTFPTYEWLCGHVETAMRKQFKKPDMVQADNEEYFMVCSISEVSKGDYYTFLFGYKASSTRPEEKVYTASQVKELLRSQRYIAAQAAIAEEPSGRIWDAIIAAEEPTSLRPTFNTEAYSE